MQKERERKRKWQNRTVKGVQPEEVAQLGFPHGPIEGWG